MKISQQSRLLYRQFAWPSATEDAVDVVGSATVLFLGAGSVSHQTTATTGFRVENMTGRRRLAANSAMRVPSIWLRRFSG
jgi:hypothetical protein